MEEAEERDSRIQFRLSAVGMFSTLNHSIRRAGFIPQKELKASFWFRKISFSLFEVCLETRIERSVDRLSGVDIHRQTDKIENIYIPDRL